jgi:hypothetical protein
MLQACVIWHGKISTNHQNYISKFDIIYQ